MNGLFLMCMVVTVGMLWFFMYTTWMLDKDVGNLCRQLSALQDKLAKIKEAEDEQV